MTDRDRPPGVILAGGEGRRIGGGKPFVALAGRPLVAHVAARLGPQCGALAVNANGDPAGYAALGLPVIADAEQGLGPLGGILAAMGWAAAQGAARVLTAPVDTPFLPEDLVARLSAVAAPVVLAAASDGVHAACGLWSVDLRGPLAEALARGVRRVTDFTDAQGAVTVMFPDTAPPGFFNVNSREDLAVAEGWIAGR